ncbi:MAG: hypothetical protein LBE92_20150 [Chryseobacterium sp.]|jgi:hypothetical protein|uniref:hypothetical protein n=1 Tax=Chryseobacterium sp. TaxID=1871047 RepID=UPI0028205608|nr:hypothetical protein [Chryseobacterium sp.]MDR2238446.1 hypothetical protein [Chryseobacterium sp.]
MKKTLLLFIGFLGFSKIFSQETETKKSKMDFYFNPSLNIGYNVGYKEPEVNNTQYIKAPPMGKVTYGITAIGGYNFLPNFALGTGLRYSFVEDNNHLVFWMIQPKIIFSPGDRPFYIDLNYGRQINHSAVSDSELWGARLGMMVSYSKRLSQEGGIVLEGQKIKDNPNAFFIGLSYGITIFSNKNYTGYGED